MPHEYDSQPPQISKFAQAFIDDFIPYIDATYRTLPDRAHRAIGGLHAAGAGQFILEFRSGSCLGQLALTAQELSFLR